MSGSPPAPQNGAFLSDRLPPAPHHPSPPQTRLAQGVVMTPQDDAELAASAAGWENHTPPHQNRNAGIGQYSEAAATAAVQVASDLNGNGGQSRAKGVPMPEHVHQQAHPGANGFQDVEAGRSRAPAFDQYLGQSMILCSGNCVCGPSDGSRTLIFSSMLIAIPSVLYLAFPGVALVKLSVAFPVVGAILMVMSLTFLFLAAATDPGILPRALKDEASSDIYFPILHDFEVDGVVHRLKYCSSCHIYRSLRASHCSDCDNCVLDFDHHCPWVGTCIARRNYKYFVLFIYSSTALCLYVFSTSIVQLMLANVRPIPPDEQGSNVMEDFKWQPMSFFLIVYTFIIAWSIGSLTVFHCILMCQGKTTREFIKKTSEGPTQNNSCGARCFEVFCTPTPSYIESLKRGCAHDGSDICHGDGLYAQFRPFIVLSGNSSLVKDQLGMHQGANDAVAGLLAQHDIHTASAASGSSREMEREDEEFGAPGPSAITAGNAAPLGTFEPRVTVTDGNDMPASMSSAIGIGPSADGDMDASQSSRASWRSMGSGSIHGSFKQKVARPNRYKSPTFTSQPEGAPIEVREVKLTPMAPIELSQPSDMSDPATANQGGNMDDSFTSQLSGPARPVFHT